MRVIVCPVKALIDIFKGLWDLIVALTTDPLGFFKGIGNAVLHPVDTFNYMWGAVETAWERDVVNGDARSRGEFFSYSLVSIVGLKGFDKAGKVGKFNKVGKGGAKVDGNNSLSSAAKVQASNSLVPIPFNVFQTAKLKELVKHNVVSAFSKGSQWTKDFFRNDLVQKALKQGVLAISNAKTLSKIRNVVNPTAFNSFFKNTFNDVIKSPLAKTKVAIDQQLRKVVKGIGKVEVPTRIRVELLDAFYGIKIPVVDLGITTMKDVVQKISGSKKNGNVNLENIDILKYKEGYYIEHTTGPITKFSERNNGVSGGHNYDEFKNYFNNSDNKYALHSLVEKKHPTIEGVYDLEYKVMFEKRDYSGSGTGEYKIIPKEGTIYKKTVYDPKIITNGEIIELGKEAMEEGIKSSRIKNLEYQNKEIVRGISSRGLKFEGIKNIESGEIENFYPVFEFGK